jgi:KaiC
MTIEEGEIENSFAARLSFGLTCIDHLVDPMKIGYGVVNKTSKKIRPIAACIAGPDGVGKSILALSAASTYAAANKTAARVIYASTDLNHDQAESTWEHFQLHSPQARRNLLRTKIEELYLDERLIEETRKRDELLAPNCKLEWVSPFSLSEDIEPGQQPFGCIYDHDDNCKVHFLDLASYSAGDDWGLINQAVGLLLCRFGATDVPHLLIVDAVEGLEAMAGNYDRFGLNRSRRSRLAQLVRLTRKANCHVIFVVEQKSKHERLDEVFISDLVFRLRADKSDEYLQKTIEVEKARSVSHIRGTHELQIRDGFGAGQDVPDDPEIVLNGNHLGYLQVIPSLHQKPRRHAGARNA